MRTKFSEIQDTVTVQMKIIHITQTEAPGHMVSLPIGYIIIIITHGLTVFLFLPDLAEPVWRNSTAQRTTRDREVPGSTLACAVWFFP